MKLFVILCAFLFGAILIHANEVKKNEKLVATGVGSDPTAGTMSNDPVVTRTSSKVDHTDSKLADLNLASHPEQAAKESELKHPLDTSENTKQTPVPSTQVNNLPSKTSENPKQTPVPSTQVNNLPSKTSENTKQTSVPPTQPSTPTTTAAPIKPTAGDWNVTENDMTCIKVHGIISLSVTVPKLNSTANEMETFTINIPPQTTAIGSCENETIRWNLNSEGKESLAFKFARNNSAKEFYLARIDGELLYPNSTIVAAGFKNDSLKAFVVAPLEKSYLCRDSVKEHIVNIPNKTDIVLTLKDFQIQAFKSSKSNGFDESIDGCPGGSHGTPDMVPIIVGCALALLVVVVLVAYLINRRRSQAHGYLSM